MPKRSKNRTFRNYYLWKARKYHEEPYAQVAREYNLSVSSVKAITYELDKRIARFRHRAAEMSLSQRTEDFLMTAANDPLIIYKPWDVTKDYELFYSKCVTLFGDEAEDIMAEISDELHRVFHKKHAHKDLPSFTKKELEAIASLVVEYSDTSDKAMKRIIYKLGQYLGEVKEGKKPVRLIR